MRQKTTELLPAASDETAAGYLSQTRQQVGEFTQHQLASLAAVSIFMHFFVDRIGPVTATLLPTLSKSN